MLYKDMHKGRSLAAAAVRSDAPAAHFSGGSQARDTIRSGVDDVIGRGDELGGIAGQDPVMDRAVLRCYPLRPAGLVRNAVEHHPPGGLVAVAQPSSAIELDLGDFLRCCANRGKHVHHF